MSRSAPRMSVFKGGLSGRYFAAWMVEGSDGIWRVYGEKHDVTDDVNGILAGQAEARALAELEYRHDRDRGEYA